MAKPIKNKKYKDWIKTQECVLCGDASMENDPHHFRTTYNCGAGQKPSDTWCLPMCHMHHVFTHNQGVTIFDEFRLDPMRLVVEHLAKYINNTI